MKMTKKLVLIIYVYQNYRGNRNFRQRKLVKCIVYYCMNSVRKVFTNMVKKVELLYDHCKLVRNNLTATELDKNHKVHSNLIPMLWKSKMIPDFVVKIVDFKQEGQFGIKLDSYRRIFLFNPTVVKLKSNRRFTRTILNWTYIWKFIYKSLIILII